MAGEKRDDDVELALRKRFGAEIELGRSCFGWAVCVSGLEHAQTKDHV